MCCFHIQLLKDALVKALGSEFSVLYALADERQILNDASIYSALALSIKHRHRHYVVRYAGMLPKLALPKVVTLGMNVNVNDAPLAHMYSIDDGTNEEAGAYEAPALIEELRSNAYGFGSSGHLRCRH